MSFVNVSVKYVSFFLQDSMCMEELERTGPQHKETFSRLSFKDKANLSLLLSYIQLIFIYILIDCVTVLCNTVQIYVSQDDVVKILLGEIHVSIVRSWSIGDWESAQPTQQQTFFFTSLNQLTDTLNKNEMYFVLNRQFKNGSIALGEAMSDQLLVHRQPRKEILYNRPKEHVKQESFEELGLKDSSESKRNEKARQKLETKIELVNDIYESKVYKDITKSKVLDRVTDLRQLVLRFFSKISDKEIDSEKSDDYTKSGDVKVDDETMDNPLLSALSNLGPLIQWRNLEINPLTVAPAFEPISVIVDKISRGETVPPEISMSYEKLRLLSLRTYPTGDKPFLTQFAMAGFYYAANGDEVVCYCCAKRLSNWTSKDDPVECHRRLNPNCRFFTNNAEVNVPAFEDDSRRPAPVTIAEAASSECSQTTAIETSAASSTSSDKIPVTSNMMSKLNLNPNTNSSSNATRSAFSPQQRPVDVLNCVQAGSSMSELSTDALFPSFMSMQAPVRHQEVSGPASVGAKTATNQGSSSQTSTFNSGSRSCKCNVYHIFF